MTPRRGEPTSLAELAHRASALEGRTLASVAEEVGARVPDDPRRSKGWAGQLVEAVLGAPGGSRPAPDFEALGVELKTIPLRRDGAPHESTYVCTAPVDGVYDASWELSHVRRKLAHVLWVPVVGDRGEPLGVRRVGRPRLWVPAPADEAILRDDWQALTELLAGGELHRINAKLGAALQLRPKAAHAQDHTWMIDEEGEWVRSPRFGFYLRAQYTRGVLAS